ncbi:DUF6415 family natural product biosynthesis protein [Streptomyces sp. NPDC127066]|uniref:DUF6415 family natural product biosynthesis protein n=1 Tax=Streptomyces sp. NPDC127066 TaxID=3347125 RepID=UPI00365D1056
MSGLTIPRCTMPVPDCVPPLHLEALETVLTKVRRWRPFDGESLLDDVGADLYSVVPTEGALDDRDLRLSDHLMQLVAIADATEAGQRDLEVEQLTEWASRLRMKAMLGNHLQAVGHLRRMTWAVSELSELSERLSAIKCSREAA